MDTPTADPTDDIAVIVKRLAHPHPSGGTAIPRAAIIAEGTRSTAILAWISDHGGAPDSTLPKAQKLGLHGSSPAAVVSDRQAAHVRRYILPVNAFN